MWQNLGWSGEGPNRFVDAIAMEPNWINPDCKVLIADYLGGRR